MPSGVYIRTEEAKEKMRQSRTKNNIPIINIIQELGEPPICACGCGNSVNIILTKFALDRYRNKGYPKFISGHNSRKHSIKTIEQLIEEFGDIPYCKCGKKIIINSKYYNRYKYNGGFPTHCSSGCRGGITLKIKNIPNLKCKNEDKLNSKNNRILERTNKILNEEEVIELEEINDELEKLTEPYEYYCDRCKKIMTIVEDWYYEERIWKIKSIREIDQYEDISPEVRHHIIPRKYGGIDNDINKLLLCHECHDYVEIKTEDWIQSGKYYDIEILKSLIINDGFENLKDME